MCKWCEDQWPEVTPSEIEMIHMMYEQNAEDVERETMATWQRELTDPMRNRYMRDNTSADRPQEYPEVPRKENK